VLEEKPVTLDQILVLGLYGFVCFVGVVFVYQRLRWRYRRRRGKLRLGFYPEGAALGNALQQLQIIAEPQTRHVVQEMLEEETEDDEAGGPDDPVRHLHRQAARIRRSEKVERLTALLPGRK
jgi:hypothetical protein